MALGNQTLLVKLFENRDFVFTFLMAGDIVLHVLVSQAPPMLLVGVLLDGLSYHLGGGAVLALLFGEDPLYHVMGGGCLIGAFFMATDYTTSPVTEKGQIIYGIGCGALTIVIRYFGAYVEGVSYAILLMNIICPLIDRATKSKPFGGVM